MKLLYDSNVHLSVCPSVYLSICLSVHLSIRPYVYLSIYSSICLTDYPSICLSIFLFICLYDFLYMYIYLSVYPSIYLFFIFSSMNKNVELSMFDIWFLRFMNVVILVLYCLGFNLFYSFCIVIFFYTTILVYLFLQLNLYIFYASIYIWVSHRVVVSALHSGWENPSSSLPINFELGWQLLLQYCHNI